MKELQRRQPASAERLRLLDEAADRELRRRYRETTMRDRIETAFELSDLARELRRGVLRAR